MDDQKPQSPPPPPPLTYEEISALAHKLWREEGEPTDKAEEHWHRAEEQLRQWNSPEPPEDEAGLPPMA